MKVFSLRIRELRIDKKISQKSLAQILGTTNSGVCDWECGRTEPSLEMLVKIANYFNVCTDYLLGRKDYL